MGAGAINHRVISGEYLGEEYSFFKEKKIQLKVRMRNDPNRCSLITLMLHAPNTHTHTHARTPASPLRRSSFSVTLAELKLHFIVGDTDLIHL